MKILLSSQDFGFGPTTQMFSLIKHLLLKGFSGEIYIKNNNSTTIFYENFIKENSGNNIFLVNDFKGNYDKYIGFYDPKIIFEGKKKEKKTIFLCNLTFLWNQKTIKKYKKGFDFNKLKLEKILNHHELILLGYLVADKNFIRNTDGIDKRSIFYKLIKNKTKFIGPIIYPKNFKREKKEFVLVQFCGQINPLSGNKFYKIYFRLIKKILSNIKIPKKIIVNPLLEKLANEVFDKDNIITTLSQRDYQKLLSQTKCLISPFGINTFFESTYYNIPTFILPEQHLGHIKSIKKYIKNTKKIIKESFLLYNLEKYSLDYESELDFIKFLEEKYNNLLKNNKLTNIDNILDNKTNLINKINLDKNINLDIDVLLNEIIS